MHHNDNVSEEIEVEVTHVEVVQAAKIAIDMIIAFELKLKEKKFTLPSDGIIKLPFNIRMLAQAFKDDLMLTFYKPIETYLEFNIFTNEKYFIDYEEDSVSSVNGQLITAQRRPDIRTIIGTSEGINSISINNTTYTFEYVNWEGELAQIINSLPAEFIIATIRQLVFNKISK